MDNLTHSLAGAVLGQMGLKKKTGLAMPTLIIAANIPDIDALAVLLGGHTHLAIRRGITHGPIAMLILPLILWGIMLWFDRWQERRGKRPEKRLPIHKGWLLALAFIGTLSHPAMDWLNSYGVRLLEPFSSRWFYGDSIFIIDVWIWAALIAGVWFSLRRENRGQGNWQRPAWISFAAVGTYIFANLAITTHAENLFLQHFYKSYDPNISMPNPIIVANPAPLTFWRREMLWRDGPSYGSDVYGFFGTKFSDERLDRQQTNMSNPAIAAAAESDRQTAAYLFWSRMPVAEVMRNGGVQQVTIRDQRFDNPLVGDRFTVRSTISHEKPAATIE